MVDNNYMESNEKLALPSQMPLRTSCTLRLNEAKKNDTNSTTRPHDPKNTAWLIDDAAEDVGKTTRNL
ncbi:unnamed protein product [Cylicostephanus goldi]|uniref:Uncharacterized protein n=1 Tax=Cylicostephanus goldi TaxID=71465 RepID=A0A3P6RT34_CYLGO|nr:unnamed protein product [Cylicostephanus goldi]